MASGMTPYGERFSTEDWATVHGFGHGTLRNPYKLSILALLPLG
jgi:hypothetical protein